MPWKKLEQMEQHSSFAVQLSARFRSVQANTASAEAVCQHTHLEAGEGLLEPHGRDLAIKEGLPN